MRLALDSDSRINLVRRYGDGSVQVGTTQITRPFIVTPERLVLDWAVGDFTQLSESTEPAGAQLAPLLALSAGIVLIGSGTTQPFPSARLRALFQRRSIALECMTLGAACRTYNILASEQRSVAAALFP
jgi:uncharacterized protein